MKKSRVLLIIVLIFALFACNKQTMNPYAGTYKDGIYYNEFYGFKYIFEDSEDYKNAKALASENATLEDESLKLMEIRDQDLSMVVYSVTVDEKHTLEAEKEKILAFYRDSGFIIEEIEFTKEIAGETFLHLNLRILNATHDSDFYIRIHEGQVLTIHTSYSKEFEKDVQRMMQGYEAI